MDRSKWSKRNLVHKRGTYVLLGCNFKTVEQQRCVDWIDLIEFMDATLYNRKKQRPEVKVSFCLLSSGCGKSHDVLCDSVLISLY